MFLCGMVAALSHELSCTRSMWQSTEQTTHPFMTYMQDLTNLIPGWQGGAHSCLRRMQHRLVKQGRGCGALHSGLCLLIWRHLARREGCQRGVIGERLKVLHAAVLQSLRDVHIAEMCLSMHGRPCGRCLHVPTP